MADQEDPDLKLNFGMGREEAQLAIEAFAALNTFLEDHVRAHQDCKVPQVVHERQAPIVEKMYWNLRKQFKDTFGFEP